MKLKNNQSNNQFLNKMMKKKIKMNHQIEETKNWQKWMNCDLIKFLRCINF